MGHLFTKVLFCNKQRKMTEGELANRGSTGKANKMDEEDVARLFSITQSQYVNINSNCYI